MPDVSLRRLLRVLPERGLIVDHPGRFAAEIARARPAARVVAAVPDASIRIQGLERLPNASVVVGDLPDERASAIVVAPTGFEGMETVRSALAAAHRALLPDGVCVLVVHTRRGAVRLTSDLDRIFGNHEVLRGGGMRVVRAVKRGDSVADEPETELLVFDGLTLETGPSVFSRSRVDAGATLLLESAALHPGASTVVDLGCGYGVIGLCVKARHPEKRVVLVDSSAAAVRLAARNASRNELHAEVVLNDGLAGLGLAAGDVLTNFPLHVTEAVRRRLLADARDALVPGGRLWLCALAQYDLRPLVSEIVGNCREVSASVDDPDAARRYRVLAAERRPR